MPCPVLTGADVRSITPSLIRILSCPTILLGTNLRQFESRLLSSNVQTGYNGTLRQFFTPRISCIGRIERSEPVL